MYTAQSPYQFQQLPQVVQQHIATAPAGAESVSGIPDNSLGGAYQPAVQAPVVQQITQQPYSAQMLPSAPSMIAYAGIPHAGSMVAYPQYQFTANAGEQPAMGADLGAASQQAAAAEPEKAPEIAPAPEVPAKKASKKKKKKVSTKKKGCC